MSKISSLRLTPPPKKQPPAEGLQKEELDVLSGTPAPELGEKQPQKALPQPSTPEHSNHRNR